MPDDVPDRQLEAALRDLKPRTGTVDRDQLFFRAGQSISSSRNSF